MKLEPFALEGWGVRLEPFSPALKPLVAAALDCDPETWAIMSSSAQGPAFEAWWAAAMAEIEAGARIGYAVRRLADGEVIGATSYHAIRRPHRSVEIGATFYRPDARGGTTNPACKLLLLEHAFAAGAIRAEFNVDVRNLRSQAAVLKLGARKEGVLRRHKVTWTGHERDTAVFSIIAEDWPAARSGLLMQLGR